jgi:hypothetical protein
VVAARAYPERTAMAAAAPEAVGGHGNLKRRSSCWGGFRAVPLELPVQ